MTKVRIAILVAVVVTAAAGTFALSKHTGNSPNSSDASASSADNIPAPEPITTTESIPQPRQEGLQPPPSDVVGISKPEREPKR
jgi:hypothetical protein